MEKKKGQGRRNEAKNEQAKPSKRRMANDGSQQLARLATGFGLWAWAGSADVYRSNYHLLSRAFSQRVTVAQVINLNILDIVSISNVDLCVQLSRCVAAGR